MAKKGTALATRAPVIVAMPAPRRGAGKVRRYAGKARHALKRGGTALARGAWEEKLAMSSIVGAGAVGYLDAAGHLDFVPDLGLGRTPTLAIGLYFAGRAFRSQKLRHAGLGLAAAAAFAFGADQARKK